MRRNRAYAVATSVATFIFAAGFSSSASAAPPDVEPSTNAGSAQALFNEAKNLILKGNWRPACPKLEQSHQLEPRHTTLFRLGECYENTDRPASALVSYRAAAAGAAAAGEAERATHANARAERLAEFVPYLIIDVAQRDGITVYRDGEPVAPIHLDTKLPTDPGEHVITARAPGKQAFYVEAKVAVGTTTRITIPVLAHAAPIREGLAAAPAPPAKESPRRAPSSGRGLRGLRPWSVALAGVGAASMGAGALVYTVGTGDDSGPQRACASCVASGALLIGGALAFVLGGAFFFASLVDTDDDDDKRAAAPPALFRF